MRKIYKKHEKKIKYSNSILGRPYLHFGAAPAPFLGGPSSILGQPQLHFGAGLTLFGPKSILKQPQLNFGAARNQGRYFFLLFFRAVGARHFSCILIQTHAFLPSLWCRYQILKKFCEHMNIMFLMIVVFSLKSFVTSQQKVPVIL